MKVLVVLFAFAVVAVNCFSSGPPVSACNTLAPNPVSHNAQPQTDPPPYCVNARFFYRNDSTFRYTPNCTYYLAFLGCDDQSFASPNRDNTYRGFFVQARSVMEPTRRVGAFAPVGSDGQLSNCNIPSDGINHRDASDKTCTTFHWTSPLEGAGNVTFRFAGVQVRMNYWANEQSSDMNGNLLTVYEGSVNDTCPPPPPNLDELLCGSDGAVTVVSALSVLLMSLALSLASML